MARASRRNDHSCPPDDVGHQDLTDDTAVESCRPAAPEVSDAEISQEELQSSLIVDRAAAAATRYGVHSDTEVFQGPVPQSVFQAEPISLQQVLEHWRATLELAVGSNQERPTSLAVGRVICVLTIDRCNLRDGATSCSSAEVFLVFLTEIPDELENIRPSEYQARYGRGVRNSGFHLDRDPGRRFFNRRVETLVDLTLCEKTHASSRGRDKLFRLTQRGRLLFNGWPTLVGLRPNPTSMGGDLANGASDRP